MLTYFQIINKGIDEAGIKHLLQNTLSFEKISTEDNSIFHEIKKLKKIIFYFDQFSNKQRLNKSNILMIETKGSASNSFFFEDPENDKNDLDDDFEFDSEFDFEDDPDDEKMFENELKETINENLEKIKNIFAELANTNKLEDYQDCIQNMISEIYSCLYKGKRLAKLYEISKIILGVMNELFYRNLSNTNEKHKIDNAFSEIYLMILNL